jgi:hypothetical protein
MLQALEYLRLAAAADPQNADHAYNLAHHLDERHEYGNERKKNMRKKIKLKKSVDHAYNLAHHLDESHEYGKLLIVLMFI